MSANRGLTLVLTAITSAGVNDGGLGNDSTLSVDLSSYIATIRPRWTAGNVQKVITTLDGAEHVYPTRRRAVLDVTLKPIKNGHHDRIMQVLETAEPWLEVTYVDPFDLFGGGPTTTRRMRVTNDWESSFLCEFDGSEKWWSGGQLSFREW